MKRNTKYFIALLVVVVLLSGILAGLLKLQKPKESSSAAVSSTDQISVLDKTAGEVKSIQVTNESGTYTLLPQLPSETQSTASASSTATSPQITFTVQELSGLPIDSTRTEQAAQSGYQLTATENLGKQENLEQFGLKTPKATVKTTFENGTAFSYTIGNVSPENNELYYILANDTVYIVDVNTNLLQGKESYVSTAVLQFTSQNTVPTFTKLRMEGTAMQVPVSFDKVEEGYTLTQPYTAQADSDKTAAIVDMLTSLNAESVVAIHPTAAQLKQYGLDSPANQLSFTTGGKEYTLLSGKKEGEYRCVMLKGVDVVYKVGESTLKGWVDVKAPFDLRSKYVLMNNIETVKQVTVTAGSVQHTYQIMRIKDEKKSTSEKAVYTYTAKKDNTQSVDYETVYKTWFNKLNSLSLLEEAEKKPAGEPSYRVTYAYFDNSKTDTLEFYAIGNRRYTVVLNGAVCGNITENDVEVLKEQ